ncbi:lipocalin-like domain-containing protein [Pontibacter toksunensis]|uniref:Lipocalin-like domain-containing protein n=1 Tax=Pontibacter toksunensis TaxID=1332631 RepID=A0ABW6BZK5_9BACT
MDIVDQLIGTWSLLRWTAKPAAGNLFYPFGKDAVGQIVYDAKGNVMVSIMKKERTLFASNDFLQGSAEEMAAAYSGFVSYCGTYNIDAANKKVIHYILISSFPNWVGQDQVRYYDIQDDFLTLRALAIGTTQHELLWHKMR